MRKNFWNFATFLYRDKSLKGLQKYEMIYPWDYFWRTKVVLDTIFSYHFVDRDLGNFLKSFINLFELFFNFHFTHVLIEVGRKGMKEPVFSMNRGFKAQLCLWAPPLPINLTQSWFTNSGMTQTWITSTITRKFVLNINHCSGSW